MGVKCFGFGVSQTRTSAFAWRGGERPEPFLFSGGLFVPKQTPTTGPMGRSEITPEAPGGFNPGQFVSLLGISVPEESPPQ